MTRPRRLRATPALRALVAETRLHPRDLVLPLFVKEGITAPVEITSKLSNWNRFGDSTTPSTDMNRPAVSLRTGSSSSFGGAPHHPAPAAARRGGREESFPVNRFTRALIRC